MRQRFTSAILLQFPASLAILAVGVFAAQPEKQPAPEVGEILKRLGAKMED